MKKSGMGSHQSATMINDEWLTPPWLLKELGEFDLDPCSPIVRPWDTALKHYNILDSGHMHPWEGRIWLNPPYGREASIWLERMAMHGNGIALIFARTETDMFHRYVWTHASGLLFIKGRLTFHTVDGIKASANAGAPSVLVSYGISNASVLRDCDIPGKFVSLV